MIKARISKRDFYANGGIANNAHFRRMRRGVWTYWWVIVW
jgi:hypothetical protein